MSVIERRREPHIEIVVMIINHEFDEALFDFRKYTIGCVAILPLQKELQDT